MRLSWRKCAQRRAASRQQAALRQRTEIAAVAVEPVAAAAAAAVPSACRTSFSWVCSRTTAAASSAAASEGWMMTREASPRAMARTARRSRSSLLSVILLGAFPAGAHLLGRVAELRTLEAFKGLLAQHRDETGLPVVVDFYSPSCGPCRMVAPAYKALAMELKGRAAFAKARRLTPSPLHLTPLSHPPLARTPTARPHSHRRAPPLDRPTPSPLFSPLPPTPRRWMSTATTPPPPPAASARCQPSTSTSTASCATPLQEIKYILLEVSARARTHTHTHTHSRLLVRRSRKRLGAFSW